MACQAATLVTVFVFAVVLKLAAPLSPRFGKSEVRGFASHSLLSSVMRYIISRKPGSGVTLSATEFDGFRGRSCSFGSFGVKVELVMMPCCPGGFLTQPVV